MLSLNIHGNVSGKSCKKKIYIDHTQSQPICTRLLPYKSAKQQITIFDRNQQH